MEAELEKRPTCPLVEFECLDLSAGAVEGDHQLLDEPFSKRMLLDERPELAHELLMVAARKCRLGTSFECVEAELFESLHVGAPHGTERRVDERWAPPARERLVSELARAQLVAFLGRAVRVREQRLEAAGIDVGVLEIEAVARAAAKKLRTVRIQRPAQPRDVGLQGVRRGGRWILAPDFVDQALERHDLVRAEKKQSQDRSLLRPAEREQAITGLGLERPEQSKGDPGTALRLTPS